MLLLWIRLTAVQSFFPKPLLKAKDQWSFNMTQQRLLGPRNPYQQMNNPQKGALVAITRSGIIRVLYQGPDNRWQDFKSESEIIASPSELLTHATMWPENIVDAKSHEKGRDCLPNYSTTTNLRNKRAPCFLLRTIGRRSFGYIDSAWISSTKI